MKIYYVLRKLKRGASICIKPTMRCNLLCDYCTVKQTTGQRPEYEEIDVDSWVTLIKMLTFPVKEIIVSGGEPLLYRGIVSLVNQLLNFGYLVSVSTNLTSERGLGFKSSNSLLINATHHEKHRSELFELNLDKYHKRFTNVVASEFSDNHNNEIDRKVKVKDKISDDKTLGTKMFLFAPNGARFDNHIELENNSKCSNMIRKPLLVIGCQRAGTSLLASCVSMHPDIRMLYESVDKCFLRQIGGKYVGTKLTIPRSIRLNQRGSRFGHLINKLVNIDIWPIHKEQFWRPFPTSSLSIQDWLDMNGKIICIKREKSDNVKSIVNRSEITEAQAIYEVTKAEKIIMALADKALIADYRHLVDNPTKTLNDICNYLDLTFEHSMLQGYLANHRYPRKEIK